MARQWAPRGILLAMALVAAGVDLASAEAIAPDSVVYRLIPSSRFEVRTGRPTRRRFGKSPKPFSGGPGGSVKVANRVTFGFDAVGVREPAH
jgi:hypothetical protein